ncbi:MAG: cyclic nucleotide-binding domain-containing protein [Thermodesulfobacteriota bacterium]
MKIDREKQRAAQLKAQNLMDQQEQERTNSRLLKLTQDLEQGNGEVLLHNDFLLKLPDLISSFCQSGKHDQVEALLQNLGKFACSDDVKLRERAVMPLSLCLGSLENDEYPELRELIIDLLLSWLEMEDDFLSVCTPVCKQLQEHGVRKLEEGQWRDCDAILKLFRDIQSGELEKSNAIRSIVGRALDGMAADYTLEELTLVCLRGRGERRANAEKTLVLLGRRAAIHLLKHLIDSQKKEDRLRLIDTIPGTCYAAAPVLREYLQKDLPWYGIRNIILLAGAIEEEELLPLVLPFLEHEDIRVQQQVVDCIYELDKDNPGEHLLFALTKVNDELKVPLVEYLGQSREPGAMEFFLDLLGRRDEFSSNVRDDLLRCLAIQLRLSESVRAVNLLNMLVDERKEQFDPELDPVAQAANHSLYLLALWAVSDEPEETAEEGEPEPAGEEAVSEAAATEIEETPTFDKDPVTRDLAKRNLHRINEEVAKLLGENRLDDASQLIYEKCIEAAMVKDFDTAEMLRDRILEVDPNALPQLIRAGERIEEERSSAISQNHISLWQELYDSLSTEEFNAIYQAMETKIYSSGSVVVEQGESSPVLYFVNGGQARLSCGDSEEEIFLKKINPGEIVGAGPFFDVSVWTVALTAISKIDVQVLHRDKYLEILQRHPIIEHSLRKFCLRNDTVCELLTMSGKDRRRSARYPASIAVEHTLLDDFGEESARSFKGEVVDISSGGCSFSIKISSKENARLLLGRNIETKFSVNGGNLTACKGQIVAVRIQKGFSDDQYSVHVCFDKGIAESDVNRIVKS